MPKHPFQKPQFPHLRRKGNNMILSLGMLLSSFFVAPFAIDIPTYFVVQSQLQTAVDAAALAGAAKLSFSKAEAEEIAYDVASSNLVKGQSLQQGDLSFEYEGANMTVIGQTQMPTVTAKLMCALQLDMGKKKEPTDGEQTEETPEEKDVEIIQNCDSLTVKARSKAIPTSRDTVLVLDTSNSMDDLGNNRPFKDVKSSAVAFLDMLVSMNSQTVDRVALVNFDKYSYLQTGLTSQESSPGFSNIKTSINGLRLYSGSGWNTNYATGLKTALDELQANGRSNANKTVIFFTDGEPNLPGPSSPSINTCIDYKNRRRHTQAKDCATTYVTYMEAQVMAQVQRAKAMDVTIHTISINDSEDGGSLNTFQNLLMDNNWRSTSLDDMALSTKGNQFSAANTDSAAIMQIFQKVAKLVKVKLSA